MLKPAPAAPAATLVVNRRQVPARSPTPPARIIKSTYGGNLFTAEDVLYLKHYIDYCQEQGLVLRYVLFSEWVVDTKSAGIVCVKFARELRSRYHL